MTLEENVQLKLDGHNHPTIKSPPGGGAAR